MNITRRPAALVIGLFLVLAACAAPETGSGASVTTTTLSVATAQTPSVTTSTTTGNAPRSGAMSAYAATAGVPRSSGTQALLVVVDGGNYVFTDASNGSLLVAYDGSTLNQLSVRPDATIVERSGVLVGGPDWPSPFLQDVRQYQAAAVRAADGGTAEVVTVGGTDSVEATAIFAPQYEDGRVELTRQTVAVAVDTGILTRLVLEYSGGEPGFSSEGAVVETTRTQSDFSPVLVPTYTMDVGFVTVGSVDEAAALAGYEIPAVGYLPEGFDLVSIAYGEAPVSFIDGERVVALTFQNAGWFVTVTFRPIAFHADPYDPDGERGYGEFSSSYSGFSLVSAGVTHAYGQFKDVAVTFDGALTDAQMRQMIDGLR